ncbi:UNVERIFIED_CONTAM: hypothetical protein Slati_1298700 [Sesamum latifolium]|uniref:Reverse transcriptase domain-containing protein n=1 Tax=Sesamum latifolium TaxID=2727402 RepID=A0AAW2XLR7_9LAMI
MGFRLSTWAVVGEDFCQAIMEFFANGRLLKQVNATLITLIPKVQLPTKVGDFRLISHCNVIYKVITKIMVKRMRLVLDKLIDNSQNAFVPDRSISDNVLLAQELLSGYNQKRLPLRCTIKVDLQKAYPDMVDWDYLLIVLRLFQFPNMFVLWVEQCISSASFSINLNGSIHGFFSSMRGLRQGDPMSSYLFVLVMESLHLLLKSKADLYSVNVLHGALQEFKVASELQANAQKSQILLSKATEHYQEQNIQLLGFTRGSLLISYCSVFILPKGVIRAIDTKLRNFFGKGLQEREDIRLHGSIYILTKKPDSIWVSLSIEYRVGDGTAFKLWLDPWNPDDLLIQRFSNGSMITGLSMDSELQLVITAGEWSWPSARHMDIREIVSKLPALHFGA